MDWEPIDTAPLNATGEGKGPWILVFSKYDHGIYMARWFITDGVGGWKAKGVGAEDARLHKSHITHWMTLPDLPLDDQ